MPHTVVAHYPQVTRAETNDKQILVERDTNTSENTLAALTEKELVEKANLTLNLMGIQAGDAPQGTTFVGAKKL